LSKKHIKKIYIFIPGYFGSTLKDQKSGRLIWGDAKEIIFGRQTLAMPIPGMKIPGALNLEAHELIPDKKLLGGLFREDAYDKTIALLKATDAEEVIPVAWDWRADPIHGIKKIDEVVKAAKLKYPDHDFVLVSHSFGSLISSYYLRYGASDYFEARENWEGLKYFSKVVISATPFRGSMAMFRNMLHGIKFGLNHNMQTPMAISTFESSYYLLPAPGLDIVCDEKENKFSLNLYDVETWIKNGFGLFHEKMKFTNASIDSRKKFVYFHLARGKKLNQLIEAPVNEIPLEKKKILYLSGYGFKTTNSGVWLKNTKELNVILYLPKEFKKWKPGISSDVIYTDGDSTIAEHSLKLPAFLEFLETKHVHEKRSHLDILQSNESQKQIYNFLINKD
jgi:hypothetical protein